jgi:DNA polymerase
MHLSLTLRLNRSLLMPAATLPSYDQCTFTGSAADFFPRKISLPTLAKAAAKCQGCPLYCRATHVVFGEGPAPARLILVGEQPGDQEDLAGHPFVGPSGKLLDDSLAAARLDRSSLYITNAVKHFKWTAPPSTSSAPPRRGKRRLHVKPTWTEIVACRPWLEQELLLVQPHLIITLGATAAQSLLGKAFRLTHHRGKLNDSPHGPILATVHPSSLLRIPDESARREARQQFIADLRLAARKIH